MVKRELVALLKLSFWCLVIIVLLFLTVPWVCLQFVIVVFPDYSPFYSLFLINLHLLTVNAYAVYQCHLLYLHQTNFSMQVNSVDPDQTALKGAV